MHQILARARGLNWPVVLFICGYHAALLIGLPFYFLHAPPGWPLVLISVALLVATQIGITAGYHRLYAHRAYEAHPVAETGLLALGTLAIQGPAVVWADDHRRHHAKVDTDDDPYSIEKGFWYAHVLWMFRRPAPLDERNVSDLLRNPRVRFQHRHFVGLSFGGNAALAALVGWLTGDWIGAVVLSWWTRLLVSHHLTWFINSLAHTWGERTFSREHSAVDNFVIALLTVGEGYHNYHHTFASDYRNGVRWYHFDPGKWTIWSLSRLGLARGLKRYDTWVIQRRLLQEDRRLLLERLRTRMDRRRVALESRVTELSERIQARLSRMSEIASELRRRGRRGMARMDAARRRALRDELGALRRALRRDRGRWRELCGTILDAPLPA